MAEPAVTTRPDVTDVPPAPTPSPRRRRPALVRHWREYLAISPFYVLFTAFGLVPLVYAVQLSTISWDGLSDPVFVGLDQFRRVLTGGEFSVALVNTVLIFLMGQVPVVIGALVAAVLLSRPGLRGAGIYQTLFFLPQVTSVVAIAVVFQSLFSNSYGIVNRLLGMVGVEPVPWLESAWGVKVVIALMIIWQTTGYFMVIFLAGLAAIDPALHESATLDGAGAVRRFFHITLPMLRPTIIFVMVTGTISGFQLFTQPQVLLNGGTGPSDSGLTMMFLQVRYLGSSGSGTQVLPDLGYAAAIGWAIFVVLVVVAALNAQILRRSRRS
ncbi:carbohydrate ABC transporter permease [Desertihabitans aurantiacus]|uniref:carbohydrate ABC transporter permease n=1 Tax=Desertihabitans aurantiacus TaxID=2282477 RepID=UPI000DF7A2FC|nr:sugar ABC transporter permease [Desertihabitans aurantiacus]